MTTDVTETGRLRCAMAQINLLVGDIAGNAQKVIQMAKRALEHENADLVLFPELTLTGYPPEDLLFRSGFMAQVSDALEMLCRELPDIAVVVGYPRERDGCLFNAAGMIRNGRIEAEYYKNLLPNYGVFDERRYFEAGWESSCFELNGTNVAITVCEDIWEPEPVARAAEQGARLILNLNASPFHRGKPDERQVVARQRARENDVSILYLNLVGGQDELVFDGGSFVMRADGDIAGNMAVFAEDFAVYEFDAVNDFPCSPLSTASGETEETALVYQALVCGVRDYVAKNGFKGAVLGLSGGIDSALTLAIAVDALGADQVEVVLMPSRYTSDMSNTDAQKQADDSGVHWRTIAIEPAFNAFLDMLSEEFDGFEADVTEENIQARCRGIILMAISNKKGRILLTTGNKSEMSVGYATLYGDMAGGFAPLKDVPKMLVYALAEYRNGVSPVIPRRVIDRPPSAELRPDQKDEDSLPPYPVLDAILQAYIEEELGVAQIADLGYDADLVKRIARLVDKNEYKRRQAPPGVKITQRAFGRDRRYPITSGY